MVTSVIELVIKLCFLGIFIFMIHILESFSLMTFMVMTLLSILGCFVTFVALFPVNVVFFLVDHANLGPSGLAHSRD